MLRKCMKALTFSYDDGTTQDVRLIEIFNKYQLKATFNINSELLGNPGELICAGVRVNHTKLKPEEVRSVYEGHEIAVHTLTHVNLTQVADDAEVIRQVEQDRLNLSELAGYEVVGMAYPCGGVNSDERVASLIAENTPIRYARSIGSTGSFDVGDDLYQYKGSIYHHGEWDKLFDMGRAFLELEADRPQLFYIWGHAFEFDIYPERWEMFDRFCAMMSGHSDIFYGTNKEVLCGEWKR